MTDTPPDATSMAAPIGWRISIYDHARHDATAEQARKYKQAFAALLGDRLYGDTRLEVVFYTLGDAEVGMYVRDLAGSPQRLGIALDRLVGIFPTPEPTHPLTTFADHVDACTHARTIQGRVQMSSDRQLSFLEAHQSHDRTKGSLSESDDLTEPLLAQLSAAGIPAMVQFVFQSDRRNLLTRRRKAYKRHLENALDADPDHSGPYWQRRQARRLAERSEHFDSDGKPWLANIRFVTATTDADADTQEPTATDIDALFNPLDTETND